MDTDNPIIQLCLRGALAEFEHRMEDTRLLYQQAWDASVSDTEACIAAHYLARCQHDPAESLGWNQRALSHADRVNDERVRDFYPSLYLSLGRSYEVAGNKQQAQIHCELAAQLGVIHQPD